jgi:hypothetical protein
MSENEKGFVYFKSYSYDRFRIPKTQIHEIKEYRDAVRRKDHDKMVEFEEGDTGWEYDPE